MAWVVFGLVTGILVHTLYPGRAKGGVVNALFLGMLGAFVGGLLGI